MAKGIDLVEDSAHVVIQNLSVPRSFSSLICSLDDGGGNSGQNNKNNFRYCRFLLALFWFVLTESRMNTCFVDSKTGALLLSKSSSFGGFASSFPSGPRADPPPDERSNVQPPSMVSNNVLMLLNFI